MNTAEENMVRLAASKNRSVTLPRLSTNCASLRHDLLLCRDLQARAKARKLERDLTKQLHDFVSSNAWKLTAPIRLCADWWRGVEIREQKAYFETHLEGDKHLDPALTRLEGEPGDLNDFLARGGALDLPTSNPQQETPDVSIVVPFHNQAELTLRLLSNLAVCLALPEAPKCEVILVDDASFDSTTRLLSLVTGASVVSNATRLGYLRSANAGAERARATYLLFLNNDMELGLAALGSAWRRISSDRTIGAVGAKLVRLDGSLQEAGGIVWRDGICEAYGRGGDPLSPEHTFARRVDYVSGCFLLTRRDLWLALGGFRDIFSPAYYEDVDYCFRVWLEGFDVVYEPNALAFHKGSASYGGEAGISERQQANRIAFTEIHAQRLCVHYPRPETRESANLIRAAARHRRRAPSENCKRVLFVDDRIEDSMFGAGVPRLLRLVESMENSGFSVTVYSTAYSSIAHGSPATVSPLPSSVETLQSRDISLEELLLRGVEEYSHIFVSRPNNMSAVRSVLERNPFLASRLTIIYDAEAIYANRERLKAALLGTSDCEAEHQDKLRDELALSESASCIVTVSKSEEEIFRNFFSPRNHAAPRIVTVSHFEETRPTESTWADRNDFLFVGPLHSDDSPNTDGMVWFIENVWKTLVASLIGLGKLVLVGKCHTKRLQRIADSSIELAGPAKELRDYFERARIFVAPTRFAAGIPLKVIQAAGYGVPVVATPLLAEQLGWGKEEDSSTEPVVRTAKTPEEWLHQCTLLWQNKKLWDAQRRVALRHAQRDFSREAFDKGVSEVLHGTQSR